MMKRLRCPVLLFAFLFSCLFNLQVSAQVSAQDQAHSSSVPEIMFRLDSHRPYEIHPGVRTGLEPALWTDNGRAFLQLLEVPDFSQPAPHPAGIYSRSNGEPEMLLFEQGLTPSNLAWSQGRHTLYFELTDQSLKSLGIFQSPLQIDSEINREAELVWENPARARVSGLQSIREGSLLAREKLQTGQQVLSTFNPRSGQSRELLSEGSPLPQSHEEINFIFSPSASPAGEFIGAKVRTESGIDHLLLWKWSTNAEDWKLVRKLTAGRQHESAYFASIDNSFGINDHGDIVLGGTKASSDELSKRRSLFLIRFSAEDSLTDDGIQEITWISKLGSERTLMHFYPGFNNNRQIVFRVKSSSGEELWLSDGDSLKVLVDQETLLKTDLGDARLDQSRQSKLSFFQSPQINNHGEILFGALLKSKRTARNIGLGFFRLRSLH